jgi:hypothetical protein
MAKIKRRVGAVAQIGGPRDKEGGRTKRDKGGERPYARYREIVVLFENVAAGGGSLIGTSPQLSNDVDITWKRGASRDVDLGLNHSWRVGYEYQAGDKITTPGQTQGSQFPIAAAALGLDGIGGWIDPPLRFRAQVVIQVTVFNDHPIDTQTLCVVFGIREWYYASDAEN